MTELKIEFERERETKRTVRFAETGDEESQKVGSLYVQKDAVSELGDPPKLQVTIKAVK